MLPSLNSLRAFEVASRRLNFRLAAEEIGVTQGAVAQHIRHLEAQLSIQLFFRQARGLLLTDTGRSYAASIRKAFELISEATDVLKPEPAHLTISAAPTFASKWLIPRLSDFTAKYPDIDLRIVASERLSNFQTDAVDVAVRLGQPPFGPGLSSEFLFDQTIIAVVSPSLQGNATGEADPFDFPLMHDGHNLWPQFLALICLERSPAPHRNIRFNQTSLAIDAAIAGQGIALSPRFYVESDLDAGRLIQLGSTEMQTGSAFYILAPRKTQGSHHITAVKDWLKSYKATGV